MQLCAFVLFFLLFSINAVTVALMFPNLTDLVTLIGAAVSSILVLIFPPLIHFVTFWKERGERRQIFKPLLLAIDIAIIVFGGIGFAFGTVASIYRTINDFEHSPTQSACPSY